MFHKNMKISVCLLKQMEVANTLAYYDAAKFTNENFLLYRAICFIKIRKDQFNC